MTIEFARTGLAALTNGLPNAATRESNTTAAQIAPKMLEGIKLFGDDNGSVFELTASATYNASFYIYIDNASGTRSILQFRNGGTALFEVLHGSGTLAARYWNGASWVALDTDAIAASTLYKIDFEVVMNNTTGSIKLYIDDTEVQSLTSADTILTAATTIDEVLIRSGNTTAGESTTISRLIIGDEELKDLEGDQSALTGAGTNSDWTGAYTDIDETGVNDTDLLTVGSAAQTSTFACDNIDAGYSTGYDVVGVCVTARGSKGPSGVGFVKPAVYSGTTIGAGDSGALAVTWAPFSHVFTQDPDTVAAWTYAGVNAMEVGVQSSAS